MSGVQAWELLNDHNYSGRLTMEGLNELLIRAGYSRQVAHKAALQRGWDRLNAGEMM